jgi:hypothetical protein
VRPPPSTRGEESRNRTSVALQKARDEGRRGAPKNKLPDDVRTLRRKFRRGVGGEFHKAKNRMGTSVQDEVIGVLGYTPRQFQEHIEKLWKSGMTWANYGKHRGQWSIDHIRPVSSFPLDSKSDEVNSLSNLQPLWAVENVSKGSKIIL